MSEVFSCKSQGIYVWNKILSRISHIQCDKTFNVVSYEACNYIDNIRFIIARRILGLGHCIDYYFNWNLIFVAAWSISSQSHMLGREKQTPHISCKQPLGWACFLLQMDKYCILKMVEKALLSTFLSQLLLQSCQALGVQIQLPSIPYPSKQKLQVCSCIVFINSSLCKFLWRHLISHA